jgi:hypothetical protein
VQRDLKVFDEPGTKHIGVAGFIQDKWQIRARTSRATSGCAGSTNAAAGIAGKGALANYDPATHTIAVAGLRRVDDALNVEKDFTHFAPRTGSSWRSTRSRSCARLRRQHDSVPRQPLRVQLPGEAELQRVAAQRLPGAGLDGGGFPGAGAARDSRERHRSDRRARRCRTRRST